MMTAPAYDPRGVVRRARFLGLSGEGEGHIPTFENLRRELGEENAGNLMVRLGVQLQSQGIEKLGMPLGDAVARVLSDMTAAERAEVAQGSGVPARVQAIIEQIRQTAELQQRSHPASGATADMLNGQKADGVGVLGNGQRSNLRAYRDMDGGREGTSGSSISGSYLQAYAGTGFDTATVKTFADVGLNRAAFNKLSGEGYSNDQIAQGARSAKRLGWKGAKETSALVHIGEDGQELTEETQKLIDTGQMDAAKKNVEEMQRRREEATDPKVKDGWGVVIEKITAGHKELRAENGNQAARDLSDDKAAKNSADQGDASRKLADNAESKAIKKTDATAAASLDDALGLPAAATPNASTKTKAAEAKPVDVKSTGVKSADAKPAVGKPAGPSPT